MELPDPAVRPRPFHPPAGQVGAVRNLDRTHCFFLAPVSVDQVPYDFDRDRHPGAPERT